MPSSPLPENQILRGDSLEVLRTFPDACIDLILTSPPYNFGMDYQASEDRREWSEYFRWLFPVLRELRRVLKSGGRLALNIQPYWSDYMPTHHFISKYLMDIGLLWKGEILWEKNTYNCRYTAWGSWKSPASPYLKYTWEFIEVFCKDSRKRAGDASGADITGGEFKEWVNARWAIAPEQNMKKYGHPAMFPEELAMRVIKLFSFRGDVVLDPFNGAGTTTAVAAKLGRRHIGIDISEKYCETARERLPKGDLLA